MSNGFSASAAPPPRFIAEELCHASPTALARTLAAFGFTRRLMTAARIGTPLAKMVLERGAQSKRPPIRKACEDAITGMGHRE